MTIIVNSVIVVIVSKVATVENISHSLITSTKKMSAVKSDEILNLSHLYPKIGLKFSQDRLYSSLFVCSRHDFNLPFQDEKVMGVEIICDVYLFLGYEFPKIVSQKN